MDTRRSLKGVQRLTLGAWMIVLLAGCRAYTTSLPVPSSPPPAATAAPIPTGVGPSKPSGQSDQVILSIAESGYAHLFAYSPSTASLTRLTSGAWSDIAPAVSADAKSIAFASNRGGQWDLYRLDLPSGQLTQVTDTPAYDGSPTWSPDMAWLAYDTYQDGHLDIAIQSMTDLSKPPLLLTDDPAADHSPAWAPNGRDIAFVSNRTGDADIWVADLNKTEDRITDVTNTPLAAENHPVWSPDGNYLAWSSTVPSPGFNGIYVSDRSRADASPTWIGEGSWPAWNRDGTQIISPADAANQELLVAYTVSGRPVLLPAPLPGRVRGLAWPQVSLPDPLPKPIQDAANATAEVLGAPPITPISGVPSQRWYVTPLQNVQAPYPQLHALVAGSFDQLRQRVIHDAGWDALASLQNAFVPLTTALDPGLGDDWLYTGRAFAINSLMVNAGWMAVEREEIGSQTYWRLYLRAQNQDGTQGEPLQDPPWDLNARYQLDPKTYETGGAFASIPPGYWVDLTSLASAYGWERLPALPNWRSYYAGARFTEFVMDGGLDWNAAMLQLYPAAALITPTVVLPPTSTPSITPVPSDTPGPSRTPRPTGSPTLSPTPTGTRTQTATPQPTFTPPTILPTFPTPTPG
jgi:TolB protein